MGRFGSLMASTCRSNQSLTAWLLAQSKGPHNTTPAAMTGQCPASATPDETTPHPNAHIGGNQVIGLSNSSTTPGAGNSGVNTLPGETLLAGRLLAGRDIRRLRGYSNWSLSAAASSPRP
jgi:hypothetical protein